MATQPLSVLGAPASFGRLDTAVNPLLSDGLPWLAAATVVDSHGLFAICRFLLAHVS